MMHEVGTKLAIEIEKKNQRPGVFEWVAATSREREANIIEAMASDDAGLACIASYDDDLGSGVPRRQRQANSVGKKEPVGIDDKE